MSSPLIPTKQPLAAILGLGMCVPERVLTNDDLAQMVDTSDEWITSRTGIRQRRIADDNTTTSDLAAEAAKRALDDAKVHPDELDLILCATATGDYIWPATACVVQRKIGAYRAGAFDLSAACAGFCYGLAVAGAFIQSHAAQRILLIGADALSKHVDWNDRSTCILFGDGAGAAVLGPNDSGQGVLTSVLGANGDGLEMVWLPHGGTRSPLTPELIENGQNKLIMQGREVYRFAVQVIPEAIQQALQKACLSPSQVDWLVMHQANIRIVEAVAERLQIPKERVFINIDRYGNTSAASVPIALTEAVQQNLLKPGQIVVTAGFGAGLVWGVNVIRWNAK